MGIVEDTDVVVLDATTAAVAFSVKELLDGVVWKLEPVNVNAAPGLAMEGVTLVIVGPADVPTVKAVALFAEPDGEVTDITPVAALGGTLTVSWLMVAAETAAETPLNVTMF